MEIWKLKCAKILMYDRGVKWPCMWAVCCVSGIKYMWSGVTTSHWPPSLELRSHYYNNSDTWHLDISVINIITAMKHLKDYIPRSLGLYSWYQIKLASKFSQSNLVSRSSDPGSPVAEKCTFSFKHNFSIVLCVLPNKLWTFKNFNTCVKNSFLKIIL